MIIVEDYTRESNSLKKKVKSRIESRMSFTMWNNQRWRKFVNYIAEQILLVLYINAS